MAKMAGYETLDRCWGQRESQFPLGRSEILRIESQKREKRKLREREMERDTGIVLYRMF